jgi:hypothetical protein
MTTDILAQQTADLAVSGQRTVYVVCYREMQHDPGDVHGIFSDEDRANAFAVGLALKLPDRYGHASCDVEEWIVDDPELDALPIPDGAPDGEGSDFTEQQWQIQEGFQQEIPE